MTISIIPYDGAKFAVAPDCDLWNSSCEIGDNNEYRFDDYFSESFLQAGISDHSYEEMMEDIQRLYNDYINDKPLQISGYITRIFKKMKEDNVKDIKI